MTKSQSLNEQAQKLFEVTYCMEQGYAIRIEAGSAEEAEHMIEQRLDDKEDVLDGSTRVHHAHFVNTVEELAIARSDRPAPQCSDVIDVLKLALLALNTARRFKVDDTDSYAIASRIDDVLRKAEGGAA